MRLLEKPDEISAGAQIAAQEAIDYQVAADRILATILLNENEGLTALNPKRQGNVDRELTTANKQLIVGDAARDSGSYDHAIEHYRRVWEHTTFAVKEAAKS